MGARGRKRAAPVNTDNVDCNTQKNSEYEQLREKRIKENLERMQKLGIFDISLKLKPVRTPIVRKTPQRLSPVQRSGPTRRSSRYTLLYCPNSVSIFLTLMPAHPLFVLNYKLLWNHHAD